MDLLTSAPEQDRIPRMRSLAEKTYELWASLYISSRFPRDDQWWPSSGEDIAAGLRNLMTPTGGVLMPAKLILLELKVPKWDSRSDRHRLTIDRAQLAKYLAGPSPMPVFYVLPDPWWTGILAGCEQCCGACTCHGGRGTRYPAAESCRYVTGAVPGPSVAELATARVLLVEPVLVRHRRRWAPSSLSDRYLGRGRGPRRPQRKSGNGGRSAAGGCCTPGRARSWMCRMPRTDAGRSRCS